MRKCTYVEVIDLRIMVLWSIGFIANRHCIPPHHISLCPLLRSAVSFMKSSGTNPIIFSSYAMINV